MQDIKNYLKEVANRYEAYFDLSFEQNIWRQPIYFHAHYYQRDERYFISKSAKMWGVEHEQHLYVREPVNNVTKQMAEQLITALQQEMKKNHPKKEEHMSTIVIGIIPILSEDEVDADIKKFAKKFRKLSFIKYGLYGWFEFYLGILDFQKQELVIHKKAKPFLEGFEFRKNK